MIGAPSAGKDRRWGRWICQLLLASAMALPGSVAGAQDYTGNVNPSTYSGPMVMQGAINAQARRHGGGGATRSQVGACARKERFRAAYGADNAKVQRLYSLCRGIGR